jgi:hypothetical protein
METGPQSENCAFKIGVALSHTYCMTMLLTCFIELNRFSARAGQDEKKKQIFKINVFDFTCR